jgi:hypothetical protein
LWDAKFRPLKEAMLHQSCFEEAFDEFEEALIGNAFCQALQQDVMMHVVKRSINSMPWSRTRIKPRQQKSRSLILLTHFWALFPADLDQFFASPPRICLCGLS